MDEIETNYQVKMPFIILQSHPNSHPFITRKIYIEPNVEIKVGRSIARNKVCENNAIFDCKVLSRNHAIFWYSAENKFFIKDTKSSNGTFVNDKKLIQSEFEEIFSGDIIKFGVDVIENSRKEVHGCIITCIRLYNSDGNEIIDTERLLPKKKIDSTCENDINRVKILMLEASNRDSYVKSKLNDLQNIIDLTRTNTLSSWQAMIDEDKLLNKIDTLENKLQYFQKNIPENHLKSDILKLLDEKHNYNNSAKKILQKANHEKIVALNRLLDIEKKYNKTENNCSILREKNNEAIKKFQDLRISHDKLIVDFNTLKTQYEILLNKTDSLEQLIVRPTNKITLNSNFKEYCYDGIPCLDFHTNSGNLILENYETLQEKLTTVLQQIEMLKNENKFLNFFYINNSNCWDTEKNEENMFLDNLIIKSEEELVIYKKKYDELLEENNKLKSKLSDNKVFGFEYFSYNIFIFGLFLFIILLSYLFNYIPIC